MTNLKKLKATNYFLVLLTLLFFSCAKVPFKGLFTDNQYDLKPSHESPVLVFHQADLRASLLSWQYIEIAKKKLPLHKIFIILAQEITAEETLLYRKNSDLFDGYILQKPILISINDDIFKGKTILSSGIIDLETDDYYLAPVSKRSFNFEVNKKKFLFASTLEKLSMPQEEREFQFYLEDPLLSMLKIRKDERKNAELNYLIMSSKNSSTNIKNQTHHFLEFKTIPEPKNGYFSMGENLIELCAYFFQETEDCYLGESSPYQVEDKIKNEREKLLQNSSKKKNATFLGEEILPAN